MWMSLAYGLIEHGTEALGSVGSQKDLFMEMKAEIYSFANIKTVVRALKDGLSTPKNKNFYIFSILAKF